jgi:hypothetical protein
LEYQISGNDLCNLTNSKTEKSSQAGANSWDRKPSTYLEIPKFGARGVELSRWEQGSGKKGELGAGKGARL